jgi:hypothetical protein
MTPEFEFRSRIVQESGDEYKHNRDYRAVELTCNEWAAEGFEVFSVLPMETKDFGRMRVRLTAKRRLKAEGGLLHKNTGRKFK